LERIRALHARVMRLHSTIYSVGQHGSAFIKGLKCSLSCLGICDDAMAEPFQRFRPAERARIKAYLTELGATAGGPSLHKAR